MGSRSIEKAEAFIQETGIATEAKPYGSYQEVLDDERVDIIYMPLPSSMHLEWVKKAAAQKKHVVCEKPLARVGPLAAPPPLSPPPLPVPLVP